MTRFGYIPGASGNTNDAEYWNKPDNWVGAGARIAYDIGKYNDAITDPDGIVNGWNLYDGAGNATETGQLTALGGEDGSSDLNNDQVGASNVDEQIQYLINNNLLSGLGVGVDTGKRGSVGNNNAEIQYNATDIDPGDRIFVGFNETTTAINLGASLFYSEEVVNWDPGSTAEQLRYQLLKQVPSGGDVTIGGLEYDLIGSESTKYATRESLPATQLDRWVTASDYNRLNSGYEDIFITSSETFDAIILRAADYVNPVPSGTTPNDRSDFLLGYIDVEGTTAQSPICFGAGVREGTGDPDDFDDWTINSDLPSPTFKYRIQGEGWKTITVDGDGNLGGDGNVSAILAVEDTTDLGARSLPPGAGGLGVGDPDGPNSNDPVSNNPEIQGTSINELDQLTEGDALEINFGYDTRAARVGLSLFYTNEPTGSGGRPERMQFQLYNDDVLVGSTKTVTASGTYAYSSTHAGLFTLYINSYAGEFDSIRFLGEDYGGAALDPTPTGDVSDYLVRGVCLSDGSAPIFPGIPEPLPANAVIVNM